MNNPVDPYDPEEKPRPDLDALVDAVMLAVADIHPFIDRRDARVIIDEAFYQAAQHLSEVAP